eukprot:gene9783-7666_t
MASGFVGHEEAIKALARFAASAAELLVVLRGHGSGAANLVMSDGSRLAPKNIKNVLQRVSFHGRVLCKLEDVVGCIITSKYIIQIL